MYFVIFFFQKNNQDLIQSSPFDCCCVKEMWTLQACLLNEKGEVNLNELYNQNSHLIFQISIHSSISWSDVGRQISTIHEILFNCNM
jgi:hypothetical protein